ncbi:hypothetical protein YC2023_092717 [Brassica napus]
MYTCTREDLVKSLLNNGKCSFGQRECAWPLPLLFVPMGWFYETLRKLFSYGGLSEKPKLPGSDSRLNLAHPFAVSGWCGLRRGSGLRFWFSVGPCFS